MKTIVLVFAVGTTAALFASYPVLAANPTSELLNNICNPNDGHYSAQRCEDILREDSGALQYGMGMGRNANACIHYYGNPNWETMLAVLKHYIHDHPAKSMLPSEQTMAAALMEEYPCK